MSEAVLLTIAAPPSGLQPEDYDDIEAAVMETARGRWFLSEYARRARAAETEKLLVALAKIDARLDALGAPPKAEAVPVVERLEALVWKLRESGVEDFVCSKIEALARDIAAGGVIGVAPQAAPSANAEAPTVSYPDANDDAIACALPSREEPESAAKVLPSGPAQDEEELGAHPIGENAAAVVAPSAPAEIASPPAIQPGLDALLWLDRLPLLDRMALFA